MLPDTEPDAHTVLHANRVEKTYGNGTHALARMSLRIQRGEFVSLLGPSGCGKSTLLKMFAGLEDPSHGHIRWAGADSPAKSGLKSAMVFQEATLMPWATVAVLLLVSKRAHRLVGPTSAHQAGKSSGVLFVFAT